MDVKVYSVKIGCFKSVYDYHRVYLTKYNKAKLVAEKLGLNLDFVDTAETLPKLNEEGKETYDSYAMLKNISDADSFVITEKQLVWLAVNNIDFKVINETTVEVDDIVKAFNLCADKSINVTSTCQVICSLLTTK